MAMNSALHRVNAKFLVELIRISFALSIASIFALSMSVSAHSHTLDGTPDGIWANGLRDGYSQANPANVVSTNPNGGDQQATTFGGEQGLDAATILEQQLTHTTRYTLRLHLASGAEQQIAVMAPPGGLQLQMLDMTGDHVPNDLILIPAFVRWPLTVLLNDGHDHFTVAISGNFPGYLGTGEDRASSSRHTQSTVALLSSGFKSSGLANGGAFFSPQLDRRAIPCVSRTIAERLGYLSSSGRAPPTLLAKI
jgi:hypothetical protein